MKGKLFQKIYFTTLASVLLCMAMIVVLLSFSVSNMLANDKKRLLSENCETVADMFEQTQGTGSFNTTLPSVVFVLSRSIDADIFLSDADGNIFLCSCEEWRASGNCAHSEGNIQQDILKQAKDGEYYNQGNMKGRYSAAYYTYGIPLKSSSGKINGYVFASLPASLLAEFLTQIVKIFVICAIIPLIIMFIIIYATTYRITKPLRMMSEASKKMATGDFSMRIPVTGNDEIGEMAVSFNRMTDSLVKLESTRRSFVANVSHELKTPMTTIAGFIDGIIDGTVPPEKQEHYLQIVSSEVKRLSRLVRSMLCLAQLESGEMKINRQTVDIVELIGKTLLSQEQRISEIGLSIQGLENCEPVRVSADPDLLQQVFYNLIDNAIKFAGRDGYIRFIIAKTDTDAVVKIRNSGEGIPESELKYVFDRFYKVDKSRSANKNSTGLGLYIVKTIVDIHGGSVTVRSKPGEYTEFDLSLHEIAD